MPSVNIRVQTVRDEEQQVGQPKTETKDDSAKKLAVASLFAHQALNVSKQIVNYEISHIGDKTGDYIKQERVQEAVNAISDIATIGISVATGNPLAIATAVIGITTKKVFEIRSENLQIKHAENNADYLRKRSGNSLENNSRTGE